MKLFKEILQDFSTEFYFYAALVIFLTGWTLYHIVKEDYNDNHRRRS